MKYFKLTKKHLPDTLLLALIALCFFLYFVIYMTPSRVAWYREMRNQMVIFYQKLTTVRR